jgi:hypothetical protein
LWIAQLLVACQFPDQSIFLSTLRHTDTSCAGAPVSTLAAERKPDYGSCSQTAFASGLTASEFITMTLLESIQLGRKP